MFAFFLKINILNVYEKQFFNNKFFTYSYYSAGNEINFRKPKNIAISHPRIKTYTIRFTKSRVYFYSPMPVLVSKEHSVIQ